MQQQLSEEDAARIVEHLRRATIFLQAAINGFVKSGVLSSPDVMQMFNRVAGSAGDIHDVMHQLKKEQP